MGRENLYEPEKILDKKKEGNRYYYLVKWKGYKASQSTWELYSNICHCQWLFDDWEVQQEKEILKQLKQMDCIIDKKYTQNNRVHYLVRLKNQKEDQWFKRVDVIKIHPEKVQEYEQNEGLILTQQHKEKMNNDKEDRDSSSNESDNQESDDQSDEEEEDDKSTSRRRKSNNKQQNSQQKTKKNSQRGDRKRNKDEDDSSSRSSSSNDDDNDSSSSSDDEDDNGKQRRIVTVKRTTGRRKKIQYEKLPVYGILGIDEPKMIRLMIIDKQVGDPQDGYFACDITWKVRPNKNQPVDSRVSRKDIKEFYPLILIAYYEDNMIYDGCVINDQNDNGSDTKSETSFDNSHIRVGYAETVEQKKFVKFDEEFKYKYQMEEMP